MKQLMAGKRVALAGGGSGGHITPLLALGEELAARGAAVALIGAFGGDRFRPLTDQFSGPVFSIPAGKIRRYLAWQNGLSPVLVLVGLVAAYRYLRAWRPDVVFAKGGYASFPVILAAVLLRLPIVVHESDRVMGLANRWSVKFAQTVCVNFPIDEYPTEFRSKMVQTGIPIDQEFFGLRRSLPHKKLTVLVTGGSQGAEAINRIIAAGRTDLSPWQILHLTGSDHFSRYLGLAGKDYEVYGFVSPREFRQLLRRADIVMARASATTYGEIAAAGRPAIVVPLPAGVAAHNHQLANAQVWQRAGAVEMLFEQQLSLDSLKRLLTQMSDPATWQRMGRAAQTFAQPTAVTEIIKVIEECLR